MATAAAILGDWWGAFLTKRTIPKQKEIEAEHMGSRPNDFARSTILLLKKKYKRDILHWKKSFLHVTY